MSKRTLFTYFSTSNSTNANNEETSTLNTAGSTNVQRSIDSIHENRLIEHEPKRSKVEFHFSDIVGDPGNRKSIEHYAFEIRDQVKRAYASRGPTQPTNCIFPRKWQNGEWRSFQKVWYDKFDWLEYSVPKDAAFCLYCYIFFEPGKPSKFGSDVFAHSGYTNLKKALHNFEKHTNCKSHNNAKMNCDDFMNQRTSVSTKIVDTSKEEEIRYKIRLTSSLEVARFLIEQGDAFRGHDESESSMNRGKFREMVEWYKNKKKSVKDAYEKGCKRNQMLSHHIQKNLTKACAQQVTKVILEELGDKNFSILLDESRDISIKEQMALILRFVNDQGKVVERLLGVQHIGSCTAIALKEALVSMLSCHKLSINRIRGQGYDGASNMRGEFNGVQKLIQDENPYAFYVHCFAHQLQLVVVTIASSSPVIADFFNYILLIVNTVGASCMRKDVLLAKHHDVLLDKVENGEISTGRGLNQESSLCRPGDTRWGSHLKTLLRIFQMWEAILEVLEIVKQDSVKPTCNGGAFGLIGKMQSFEFVFIMFFMIDLLSITNDLSHALQRKDQDIVEATSLIMGVKDLLQDMRENGWEPLFKRVQSFCDKNEIKVPKMDKEINTKGTYSRKRQKVTNKHFYHIDIFTAAIDSISIEMNHRFNEISSELLVCMAALNPRNNFSNFDVEKLVRLAEIYAEDFTIAYCLVLRNQLQSFILNIRRSQEFVGCKDLPNFAEKMVETGKSRSFPLVYRLIELILILPVATASVERVFSAMNHIKTDLRNKMGDEWLNDLMICYSEKEIFRSISNEKIIQEFEDMKKRHMLVPKNKSVIVTHED